MSGWIRIKGEWQKCRRPVAHMTRTSWFAARSCSAGLFSFIRLCRSSTSPYPAQVDLTRSKTDSHFKLQENRSRTILFIGEKRIFLFSVPYSVFSSYLSIVFRRVAPFILTGVYIHVFFLHSLFSLFTFIFCSTRYIAIVLSLANGCMSISWPVCCEFYGKQKSSKKLCNVESYFGVFFTEYINVISCNHILQFISLSNISL